MVIVSAILRVQLPLGSVPLLPEKLERSDLLRGHPFSAANSLNVSWSAFLPSFRSS